MVHVCFGLHDANGHYSKFVGTAILSMLENYNTPPQSLIIHILHDDTLTIDNREKFISLVNSFNQLVKFYNVEKICADKISEYIELIPAMPDSRYTVGSFYRFLIPNALDKDIKKAIYLDGDVIINLDIKTLWQIDIGDSPLGVVLEKDMGIQPARNYSALCKDGFINDENYFNSGMLVMNLEVLRNEEETLRAGLKFLNEHPEYIFFDQEILNYCFETRTFKLPVRFNHMTTATRKYNNFTIRDEIYHYVGTFKGIGLNLNMNDPFCRLWMNYFLRTPFFSVETISNIYETITQFDNSMQGNLLMKFSAATAGKGRVFVATEETVDDLEINFTVREDEDVLIVDLEDEDSLQHLRETMTAERGQKIFFTMVEGLTAKLKNWAFIEGEDFFDAFTFAPLTNGTIMKPYEFLKEGF